MYDVQLGMCCPVGFISQWHSVECYILENVPLDKISDAECLRALLCHSSEFFCSPEELVWQRLTGYLDSVCSVEGATLLSIPCSKPPN